MSDGEQRNGEGSGGQGGLRHRFQDRLTAAQNLLTRLKLRAFNLKQERDFHRFFTFFDAVQLLHNTKMIINIFDKPMYASKKLKKRKQNPRRLRKAMVQHKLGTSDSSDTVYKSPLTLLSGPFKKFHITEWGISSTKN
jgi:hypothetical protein